MFGIGQNSLLVGGFNPSEKYEIQIGSSSQLLGKIKFMFQTTNQFMYLDTRKYDVDLSGVIVTLFRASPSWAVRWDWSKGILSDERTNAKCWIFMIKSCSPGPQVIDPDDSYKSENKSFKRTGNVKPLWSQ